MEKIQSLMSFLDGAKSVYHAIEQLKNRLEGEGYTYLPEGAPWYLETGGKYYMTRGGTSLIAFRIPADTACGFMMSASHSDRPTFKLKENGELTGAYTRLSTERYGGMLISPWLDRPLSLAGRVLVETQSGTESRLVDIDRDLLLADLIITDGALATEILGGKREISCGYRCEWEENPDGTMTQRNIRGNHVALVSSGRAGARAAIMDSNTHSKADNPPERKSFMSKTNSLLHFFGLAANGKTEEEVRRMADSVAPVFDEDTAPEHEPEGKPVPEEDAKDEAPAAAPAIDADALAKAKE